jgi:chromate reductase
MMHGEQQSRGGRLHRVLAIAGSLRQRSYNRMLLLEAGAVSPRELELELYAELASIPLFDEDLEGQTSGGPPPVKRLRAKVKEADGLLISTPEYNQSMSGVLKNAIDWLSRPGPEEVLIISGNATARDLRC